MLRTQKETALQLIEQGILRKFKSSYFSNTSFDGYFKDTLKAFEDFKSKQKSV